MRLKGFLRSMVYDQNTPSWIPCYPSLPGPRQELGRCLCRQRLRLGCSSLSPTAVRWAGTEGVLSTAWQESSHTFANPNQWMPVFGVKLNLGNVQLTWKFILTFSFKHVCQLLYLKQLIVYFLKKFLIGWLILDPSVFLFFWITFLCSHLWWWM